MPRSGRPPDDGALAASLAPDGVFRVAPPPAPRTVPRLRRRVVLVVAALAMCAIPGVGLAGLADDGMATWGQVSDGTTVAEARYRAARVDQLRTAASELR